ncbi:MAG: hypothetical protein E3J75_00375 [Dehalococcoidia bacterium]|nr:MAG: hypothetical protein E3J75_00375 [Dehalococcoidia bacterium]
MRRAALVFGILGGISAVVGGLTVGGVPGLTAEGVPVLGDQFTWMFWFVLSAVLLLASIAFAVSRGGGE